MNNIRSLGLLELEKLKQVQKIKIIEDILQELYKSEQQLEKQLSKLRNEEERLLFKVTEELKTLDQITNNIKELEDILN